MSRRPSIIGHGPKNGSKARRSEEFDRLLLRRYNEEDMTVSELAAEYDIGRSTVWDRLQKARQIRKIENG